MIICPCEELGALCVERREHNILHYEQMGLRRAQLFLVRQWKANMDICCILRLNFRALQSSPTSSSWRNVTTSALLQLLVFLNIRRRSYVFDLWDLLCKVQSLHSVLLLELITQAVNQNKKRYSGCILNEMVSSLSAGQDRSDQEQLASSLCQGFLIGLLLWGGSEAAIRSLWHPWHSQHWDPRWWLSGWGGVHSWPGRSILVRLFQSC